MKNSSDTIGNRTCGLPTCSTVPQPTQEEEEEEELNRWRLLSVGRSVIFLQSGAQLWFGEWCGRPG